MINYLVTKVIYEGDGVTQRFPFAFPFADVDDVKVLVYDGASQSETLLAADYFVDAHAHVVLYPGYAPGEEKPLAERPPLLAKGQKLVIYRRTPMTQMVDLGEKYPLPTVERMPDKLTMIVQELREELDRCVKGGISGTKPPHVIVEQVPGGGKGLLSFPTMAALVANGTKGLSFGSEFKLLGYYRKGDGGGGCAVCGSPSLSRGGGRYAE